MGGAACSQTTFLASNAVAFVVVADNNLRCAVRCTLNAGVADDAPLPVAVVGDDVGLSRGGSATQDGATALILAAVKGHTETVPVLRSAGAPLAAPALSKNSASSL